MCLPLCQVLKIIWQSKWLRSLPLGRLQARSGGPFKSPHQHSVMSGCYDQGSTGWGKITQRTHKLPTASAKSSGNGSQSPKEPKAPSSPRVQLGVKYKSLVGDKNLTHIWSFKILRYRKAFSRKSASISWEGEGLKCLQANMLLK